MFGDADWAGNVDPLKFISGYCVCFGGALVSWKLRLRSVYHYQRWSPNFTHCQWLPGSDMVPTTVKRRNCAQDRPTIIYEDNQSTTAEENHGYLDKKQDWRVCPQVYK